MSDPLTEMYADIREENTRLRAANKALVDALRFSRNAIQLWASFASGDARYGLQADLAKIDAALAAAQAQGKESA